MISTCFLKIWYVRLVSDSKRFTSEASGGHKWRLNYIYWFSSYSTRLVKNLSKEYLVPLSHNRLWPQRSFWFLIKLETCLRVLWTLTFLWLIIGLVFSFLTDSLFCALIYFLLCFPFLTLPGYLNTYLYFFISLISIVTIRNLYALLLI